MKTAADVNTGEGAGGLAKAGSVAALEGVRSGGVELSGRGPQTTEALTEMLRTELLGATPETEETEAGQTPEKPEGVIPEGEPEEGAEDDSEEGEEESAEEEAAGKPEWPKSAVGAIAEERAKRRELKGEFEQLGAALAGKAAELEEARRQLEEAQQGQPITVAGQPLSFLRSEAEVKQWTAQVRSNMRAIEDYLDGAASPEQSAFVEEFAKQHGAWDAEENAPKPALLKKAKRDGEDALALAPAREQELAAEKTLCAKSDELFPFLKQRDSQEYKDAMQVLKEVPGLRALPTWKFGAAVYALGLKEARKIVAAAKDSKAANGKTAGHGTNGKPKAAVNRLPGKSVTLPRAAANAATANVETLRKAAFGPKSTRAAVEAYTKAMLVGQ